MILSCNSCVSYVLIGREPCDITVNTAYHSQRKNSKVLGEKVVLILFNLGTFDHVIKKATGRKYIVTKGHGRSLPEKKVKSLLY